MKSLEPESRVFVGRAAVQGSIERYARAFDLVELSADPGRHPARKVLRSWREAVPEAFVFNVVVPTELARLEGEDAQLLAQAIEMTQTLRAGWWVLRTPPSATPSARTLRHLERLLGHLRPSCERIAWEPRGVWSEEDLLRAAGSLGVNVVRDLTREDPLRGETEIYTRVRALGQGMRVTAGAAERLADRLADATRSYVVIEGAGAAHVRKSLRAVLGDAGADDLESGDDESPESGEGDDRSEEE